MYCSCHSYDVRLASPGVDGTVRSCLVCRSQWRLERVADGPLPGWRGQWSGWIEVRVHRSWWRRLREAMMGGPA